jgi:hypothetical protein
MFAALPSEVQKLARDAYKLFVQNPAHPSLRHHGLDDTKKGRHKVGSFSVSITMQYRAIYVIDNGVNVWYWIGTHAQYKTFTASKK